MDKQNKTTLETNIDELVDKLTEYGIQKESLENKINFLETKEVSSTKKLYKSYKANNVDITYNDTKSLIKEHKFLFQVSINDLTKKINDCSKELNENKSHLLFLTFLDKECSNHSKKKVTKKKVAKKEKSDLESMYVTPLKNDINNLESMYKIQKSDEEIEDINEEIIEDNEDNSKDLITGHSKEFLKWRPENYGFIEERRDKCIYENHKNIPGFSINRVNETTRKYNKLVNRQKLEKDLVNTPKNIPCFNINQSELEAQRKFNEQMKTPLKGVDILAFQPDTTESVFEETNIYK